jgi:stage IV sporulation protein FB
LLLGEPPATKYDFNFQIAGVPVRVHPYFWLAGLILGSHGDSLELLVWIAALFVSILIHELGHSMMMRRFGISSHIVLHMMGGLAIPDSSGFGGRNNNARSWILIAFAGPAAGFVFASLIVVAIKASGGIFQVQPRFPIFWEFALNEPPSLEGPSPLVMMVGTLLYINIFWGLLNLVPVYPLDGGQIARHVFTEFDPGQGVIKSLWLSVFAGGALAAMALMSSGSLFMTLMFGMLAYQSYTAIQQSGGGGFGGGYGGGYGSGRGGRPW